MTSPVPGKRRGAAAVVRNRRGASTRATILAAAQKLLRAEGFEAVSIDRVARAAKVTRSSIYHQFHSRDEFLLHLIAESLRTLQRERTRSGPAASALTRFLDEADAGFRADPNLLRMFYQLVFDGSRHGPKVDRLLREAYRFRTQRYAQGLAGERNRLSNRDAETLAIVLAATLDGLYARHLIDLDAKGLGRAFRMVSELIESRIGAGSAKK